MNTALADALPAAAVQTAPVLRPYEARDHAEVVDLITSIQQDEFSLPIAYDDQFDLKDMEGTSRRGKGNFWVACAGGRVIGTVGLIDAGGGMAAVKKMFVRREYRGAPWGVAQKLLDVLLDWARAREIRDLYLGTTERFVVAQRFYERNGFRVIADEKLPSAIVATRAQVDTKHYHRSLV